jgi:hypothetical protein
MTTLDIMINTYEAMPQDKKDYADKYLPKFENWYNYNLNHWTNPTKDINLAMAKTIDEFIMWFNALANNNYGLQD